MVNIYVGNLSTRAIEADLRRVFSVYGDVVNVSIPRRGRRPRGFGFVEMPDEGAAHAAIASRCRPRIHGKEIVIARSESRLSGAYLMDVQDDYGDTSR